MKKEIPLHPLIWPALALCLIFTIPLIIYGINFYPGQLSKDTSDWNNLGGFIGGILGPLFSIVNTLIVYYVALLVNSIGKNQRVNDFRYNAHKDISSLLFDLIKNLSADNEKKIPAILIIQFKFSLESYNKLFNSIQQLDLNQIVDNLYNFRDLGREKQLKLVEDLYQLMKNIVDEMGFD